MYDSVTVHSTQSIGERMLDERDTVHSYSEDTMSDKLASAGRMASYSEKMLNTIWPDCDYEKYIFSYVDSPSSVVHYFRKERLEPIKEEITDDITEVHAGVSTPDTTDE